MYPTISVKFLDVDLRLCVWDHNAIGGLNIQNCAWQSNRLLFYVLQRRPSIICNEAPLPTLYSLSLECIAKPVAVFCAFVGTSLLKKFCLVDILVVSFPEELFVKFLCSMPCKFFLLLISLCTSLVVRWCIWRSSKLWYVNLMLFFLVVFFCVIMLSWAFWTFLFARGFPLLSSGCSQNNRTVRASLE